MANEESPVIVFVCGAGVATCIMMKMAAEEALEKLGLKPNIDCKLIVSGFAESLYFGASIFVSYSEYAKMIRNYAKENNKDWTIVEIKKLNDAEEMAEKLSPILKKAK